MKPPLRAIHLKSDTRSILEVSVTCLEDLQACVGGYIGQAFRFPNGDCLFVDDEGLSKDYQYGILVEGAYGPFLGNGIVVGAASSSGDNTAAKSGLIELVDQVAFISLAEIRRAHALGRKLPLLKPELYHTGDEC